MALPAVGVRATEIVACIERAWSRASPSTVACHGDLTPASLFFDGRQVWIVDYRWAGAGDPFEDLGSIVAHLEVGIERRESLLAMYFGTVRETERARLALMSLVAHYLSAMRSSPGRSHLAEPSLSGISPGSSTTRWPSRSTGGSAPSAEDIAPAAARGVPRSRCQG